MEPLIATLVCRNCLNEYPATSEFFYKREGYFRTDKCILCRKKYEKQKRQEKRLLPKSPPKISTCIKCGQEKPMRSGNTCGDCVNAWARKRNNPIPLPDSGVTRTCCKCKEEKPASLDYFFRKGSSADGLGGWCRVCTRDYAREMARIKRATEEGREQHRLAQQQYRISETGKDYKRRRSFIDNFRRRERMAAIPLEWEATDWEQCKVDWDYKCAYCGESGVLTQEHFIPISDPDCPGTIRGNIVPSCESCNYSKGNKSPFEWCKSKEVLASILDYFASLQ